ncbi:hypothetical protein BZA05DRAFT_35380 [Tricharina praecox]|uniref:uncharacterized protein n=1 Tax=Tricharina praecox TaxID=43433 RepID=UPI00221F0489|nr:uncharacterized protein BZA05DRAFT_35380 [Tricharina praecox]KAI5852103.1 hypothetical protein BZA05DRAFT_35380 [Tricharina praecox]
MASFFSSPASLGALDGSAGALEKASSRSFAFVSVRSSCLLCPRHFQLEWTDSNSMDGSVGRRDWPYSTGTAACWSIAHGFLTRSASGSVQISWKHRLDGGCWLHRGDEREAVQTSTFRDRHLNPPVWTLDRPLASKRDMYARELFSSVPFFGTKPTFHCSGCMWWCLMDIKLPSYTPRSGPRPSLTEGGSTAFLTMTAATPINHTYSF